MLREHITSRGTNIKQMAFSPPFSHAPHYQKPTCVYGRRRKTSRWKKWPTAAPRPFRWDIPTSLKTLPPWRYSWPRREPATLPDVRSTSTVALSLTDIRSRVRERSRRPPFPALASLREGQMRREAVQSQAGVYKLLSREAEDGERGFSHFLTILALHFRVYRVREECRSCCVELPISRYKSQIVAFHRLGRRYL